MFTNAGMVPFKNVFTGLAPRPAPRAATVQKCIRISGKHNDLENVGRTSRHHTFFEMLGNFSFGDYFKKEALEFGWEYLTRVMGLDPNKLSVSIFGGSESAPADTETEELWRSHIGVPKDRIFQRGAKDNFWSMGDVGPCGPCSEIHYDRGDAFGPTDPENGERYFELWNLVFMQYTVDEPGGPLKPLPAPCIDTGAGLERIASVAQNVGSNYDIDIFAPLIEEAAASANIRYGADPQSDVSLRVIADHARMAAFLISEGIFPEKTGREYVLRRVMRRAVRHGHRIGIGDLFLHKVAKSVVETMHEDYPELADRVDLIDRVCRQEEERFRETLVRGLDLLRDNRQWLASPNGERVLPGELAFDLTATYGFPKDLIQIIGDEQGFVIDEDSYETAKQQHRVASGPGKIGDRAVPPIYTELLASLGNTAFVGYEEDSASTQVLAIIHEQRTVEIGSSGQEIEVVLAETPFYGESGGQVGDTGQITWPGGSMDVLDATRPLSGLWIHHGIVKKGALRAGDEIEARIHGERRLAVCRHHTATHLLHWAIREVLGPHATQKGSRVAPELLRFDFAHFEPLSGERLIEIERLVATEIMANHEVQTAVTTYDQARAQGAIALFEEKYDESVRLVSASQNSKELCGGTHVRFSGQIGPFYIVGETGIAAGVRRIEAVAGMAAHGWVTEQRRIIEQASQSLKATPQTLCAKLEKILAQKREIESEMLKLKQKLAAGKPDLMDKVRQINGVKVLGGRLDVGDPAALRDTADTLRRRIATGIVCLGGENRGKAAIVVAVTKDLKDKFDARELIREVAGVVGGVGGGRADLAQAGGPQIDRLDAAIEQIYNSVARAIKQE
jgi:alanyl-tRNA synthetase